MHYYNIDSLTEMNTHYGSKTQDKENQYHHDIQISPQKGRKNTHINIHYNLPQFNKKGRDVEDVISPSLLKGRQKLAELWLPR